MRIAIVQNKPVFGEVQQNIERVLKMMDKTTANLYVLPELFASGYLFASEQEIKLLAEKTNGRTYQAIADFAYDKQCYVVYGFAERDDEIYNSAALVGPEGLIGVYRKVHLYDREKLFFKKGNLGFQVFPTAIGTIGIMICFDWIFPESARTLALKGATIIAHPSNLVLPYCPDAMVTRAIENKIYTATANRVGKETRAGVSLSFIGTSEIVAPTGKILKRLSASREGIAVEEIDISLAESKAINTRNHLFGDRVPEFYSLS